MTPPPAPITAGQVRAHLLQRPGFGQFADLSNRLVTDALNLRGQTLCGCDFSGTVFAQGVDFSGAVFRGLSWFRHAEFRDSAGFDGACFWNDARFDHAVFHKTGRFCAAEFRGVGSFDHLLARDGLVLDRTMANGNLSLAHSRVHGPTHIRDATLMGGMWFAGADHDSLVGLETSDIYGRVVTGHRPR